MSTITVDQGPNHDPRYVEREGSVIPARRVERYGVETWENAEMDAARKQHCLCLHCDRLNTTDARSNCPMAAVLFSLCQTKGMAMGVSRCQDFVPKARP